MLSIIGLGVAAPAAEHTSTMSSSEDRIDSMLKSISGNKVQDEVSKFYDEAGQSMKEMGAPTNNMLLNLIYAESKRMGDETMRVVHRLDKIEQAMLGIDDGIKQLCNLVSRQTDILASIKLDEGATSTAPARKENGKVRDWYYRGTKLTTKYYAYTCILVHLIAMVELRMEQRSIQYPDSVDCGFVQLQSAVRVVSTSRCAVRGIDYKAPIQLGSKDDQALDNIYPIIASSEARDATTLSESQLNRLQNPITRPIMQYLEWIRARLCLLEGLLSPKQIDILKSIRQPLILPDSDNNELNFDVTELRPRQSHPATQNISALTATQKTVWIQNRMKGRSIVDSIPSTADMESTKDAR